LDPGVDRFDPRSNSRLGIGEVARWKHYEQALAPLLAELEVGAPNDRMPQLERQ
jgi:hypothetical protein